MSRERRVKVLSIPAAIVIDFIRLVLTKKTPDATLDMGMDLPPDCEVVFTLANHFCNQIDVLLWHPSFAVVPDGEEPPRIRPDHWRWEVPDDPVLVQGNP